MLTEWLLRFLTVQESTARLPTSAETLWDEEPGSILNWPDKLRWDNMLSICENYPFFVISSDMLLFVSTKRRRGPTNNEDAI